MMDSKILEMTFHIKNINKEKVSYEKILSNLEKRDANTFVLRNGDFYTFHDSCDNTILFPETLEMSN